MSASGELDMIKENKMAKAKVFNIGGPTAV